MDRPRAVARSAVWVAIAVAVSLLAIMAFLYDLYPRDWRDWGIAGAIVAGAAGAIVAFRRDSLARAVMWFVSLGVVAVLVVYDVLDALVDPFIEADWPIAVIAILLVIGLATLLGILISDDE
jgi:peptidoglycan/LPS O-acetylase OafA/YrhL